MVIPNRHIMYQRYQDKDISESEYKDYLTQQEERERQSSEKFEKFIRGVDNK